ncbi:MAG: tRNA (adenosine(37)-N6)-dimethylallyltransferase MiaA [Novosphingobium sp.]|nr:tRNA (adenosine(37)-N6)-dimethylallyltransferase MiaA [Novosphingobium sp.]
MSTENSPAFTSGAPEAKPPLALIAGPTASGKSDVAVQAALALKEAGQHTVILNADSAQVYRDLAVLSARPTTQEMQGIEHRLFGTWDGAEACSAPDWAARAREEIATLHDEGSLPILVGGTGLYLRTLLDGIAPVPQIAPEIRAEVRAMSVDEAYAALSREDHQRATILAPNDTNRITRALEVVRSTGKTLGDWQAEKVGGIGDDVALSAAILLPERQTLYQRCDKRFAGMLERGAIAEVETLLARGLDPKLPVMRAIGVPEIAGLLAGDWDLQEAESRAAQATRNYAKRQFTWFRNQPPADWPRIEYDNFVSGDNYEIILRYWQLT